MKENYNPDLNIVEPTKESLVASQADKIYDLLPKLQVIMAAIKHRHHEQTNDDVLLGAESLLSEMHGELCRIARKIEENQ